MKSQYSYVAQSTGFHLQYFWQFPNMLLSTCRHYGVSTAATRSSSGWARSTAVSRRKFTPFYDTLTSVEIGSSTFACHGHPLALGAFFKKHPARTSCRLLRCRRRRIKIIPYLDMWQHVHESRRNHMLVPRMSRTMAVIFIDKRMPYRPNYFVRNCMRRPGMTNGNHMWRGNASVAS